MKFLLLIVLLLSFNLQAQTASEKVKELKKRKDLLTFYSKCGLESKNQKSHINKIQQVDLDCVWGKYQERKTSEDAKERVKNADCSQLSGFVKDLCLSKK